MSDLQLTENGLSLIGFLLLRIVMNFAIATDAKEFVPAAWNVYDRRNLHIFLTKVKVCHSATFFVSNEVPLICLSCLTRGNKSQIIMEPINSTDSVSMALATVVGWRLPSSIKVVDLCSSASRRTCKKVTAKRKFNFAALFDLNLAEYFEYLRKDIHAYNLIAHGHADMEATGVERYGQTIFVHAMVDLAGARLIVPDTDRLVFGAGNHKLFSDAHIKTCDLGCVECAVHKVDIKLWLRNVLINRHLSFHNLIVLSDEVNVGGDLRMAKRSDDAAAGRSNSQAFLSRYFVNFHRVLQDHSIQFAIVVTFFEWYQGAVDTDNITLSLQSCYAIDLACAVRWQLHTA